MFDDRSVSVHRFTPMTRRRFQLVCFPPDGRPSSFHRSAAEALAPSTEVLSVRYAHPSDGALPTDAELTPALHDGIAEELAQELDSPTVLFGQGPGAVIALEVARRLELAFLLNDSHGARLAALLVSAQPAPSCRPCAEEATINCPIGVFFGDADPRIGRDEAAAWAYHGKERFDFHVLHGGKDYFAHRPAELLNALSDYLLMLG
ncbi:thioesterase domain-containing protein [Streptomyces sp. GESEQ-35]|uniref:thioesterase II family protein n=1 Tax=Streptomyces sp. GESEQ-35 TaxID=2812657 RepID=UPI001B325471|nr:thioesterase domain-containing protein [Streptomyces sp. GESEQ-35]